MQVLVANAASELICAERKHARWDCCCFLFGCMVGWDRRSVEMRAPRCRAEALKNIRVVSKSGCRRHKGSGGPPTHEVRNNGVANARKRVKIRLVKGWRMRRNNA